MGAAALSMIAFGFYLAAGGLALLAAPLAACDAVGLAMPGDAVWPRFTGMLMVYLAFYCVQAARSDNRLFMWWSVFTRPWTLLLGVALVCGRLEHPVLLLLGAVDVAASAWTATALALDARYAMHAAMTNDQ